MDFITGRCCKEKPQESIVIYSILQKEEIFSGYFFIPVDIFVLPSSEPLQTLRRRVFPPAGEEEERALWRPEEGRRRRGETGREAQQGHRPPPRRHGRGRAQPDCRRRTRCRRQLRSQEGRRPSNFPLGGLLYVCGSCGGLQPEADPSDESPRHDVGEVGGKEDECMGGGEETAAQEAKDGLATQLVQEEEGAKGAEEGAKEEKTH